MQIIEFPSEHNNEMFLTEFIIRLCKYKLMSVRTEVVLNEAILHRSNSYFFCNHCEFPIWFVIITRLCQILLMSTKEVYKTEVPSFKFMFVESSGF